jgi:hypothetical protein
MSEVKKCPKCSEKMVRGSEQTLDDAFRRTREGMRVLRDLRNTTSGFNLTTVKTADILSSNKK